MNIFVKLEYLVEVIDCHSTVARSRVFHPDETVHADVSGPIKESSLWLDYCNALLSSTNIHKLQARLCYLSNIHNKLSFLKF